MRLTIIPRIVDGRQETRHLRELPSDPHKRAGVIRCERLECLRVTTAYRYAADGSRVCVWCWKLENP